MYRYPFEEFIQESAVKFLEENGWDIKSEAGLREHGIDIIAGKYGKYNTGRKWTIEVKGGSRKYKDFCHADTISVFHSGLAEIITRMGVNNQPAVKGGNKFSLAMPDYFRKHILKTTSAKTKIPWNVMETLNLSILLVDKNGKVEHITWKEVKRDEN